MEHATHTNTSKTRCLMGNKGKGGAGGGVMRLHTEGGECAGECGGEKD